jgi:branched-subunit amino acid transport protein
MRVEIALLLLGMAAVTFLPRFLPLALFSRWTLSPGLKAGLSFMPVAILSAIVFPILFSNTESAFTLDPQLLVSALFVVVLTYFFRNLWLAVIIGMLAYWILGTF